MLGCLDAEYRNEQNANSATKRIGSLFWNMKNKQQSKR